MYNLHFERDNIFFSKVGVYITDIPFKTKAAFCACDIHNVSCFVIYFTACGPYYLSAEVNKSKVLTSPNYPSNYSPLARCSWLIKASRPGQVVKLRFTNFDLPGHGLPFPACDQNIDHVLRIYNDYYITNHKIFLLGMYCGKTVPADVFSTDIYLRLYFARVHNIFLTKHNTGL